MLVARALTRWGPVVTREVIERMILGNHVRVTADLLGDGRARVIEYRRTRPGRERGELVKGWRGRVLPLAQLGLSEPLKCQPAVIGWRNGSTP